MKGKTEWLRLESRIRAVLRNAGMVTDRAQLFVRIDEIIASETGRGPSLDTAAHALLGVDATTAESIESEEWAVTDTGGVR